MGRTFVSLLFNQKKKINQKQYHFKWFFFKVQFYFCIQTLFFFDWIFFFWLNTFFFDWLFFPFECKKFWSLFFFDWIILTQISRSGRMLPPLVGHVWVTRLSYTNDIWVAISFYNKQVAICNVPAADGGGKAQDGTSVVVESLCLESESRLESPVSESESSPSHLKKIWVESTTHTSQVRVEFPIDPHRVRVESESALKHTCCYTLKNITVVPFITVSWIAYYAIHKTWLWATAGLRSTSVADQRGVQVDPIRSASRIRSESRDTPRRICCVGYLRSYVRSRSYESFESFVHKHIKSTSETQPACLRLQTG